MSSSNKKIISDITTIITNISKELFVLLQKKRDKSTDLINKFSTTFTAPSSNNEIAFAAADAAGTAVSVSNEGSENAELYSFLVSINVRKTINEIISKYGSLTIPGDINVIAYSASVYAILSILYQESNNTITQSDFDNSTIDGLDAAMKTSNNGGDAVAVAVATINAFYKYTSFRNLSPSAYVLATSSGAAAYASYTAYSTYNEVGTDAENAAATAGAAAGTAGATAVTYFTDTSCFTKGSTILTPGGYKKIEEFKNGDSVTTSDGRVVRIKVTSTKMTTTEKTAPYLIPKGCLGYGIPKNDLRLSPDHAIRIKKGVWVIPRLAKDLYKQIKQYGIGDTITYYHLETPNFYKDHLVCNESIVESYSGHQLDSVEQELYYQKNLYVHYLSGVSDTTSESDDKESYDGEFNSKMISCPQYVCINNIIDNTNFI